MRALVAVLASLASVALAAQPTLASCAPPAPIVDKASAAVAVVYGTVTRAAGGSVTLRVDRVLKGSGGGTLTAFLGPGRGGAVAATSVDYSAAVGTDHVLYLIRGADGELETNACIGSHPGQPTSAEAAFFGAGVSPLPGTGAPLPQATPASFPWPALVALVLGAAAAWLVRRIALRRP